MVNPMMQMLSGMMNSNAPAGSGAQGVINNNAQSQYLLGQMGKWVANAPAANA